MRNMSTCELDKMRQLVTGVRTSKPYLGQRVWQLSRSTSYQGQQVNVPEVGHERPPASTSGDWAADDRLYKVWRHDKGRGYQMSWPLSHLVTDVRTSKRHMASSTCLVTRCRL